MTVAPDHLSGEGRRCYRLLAEMSYGFGVIDFHVYTLRIDYLDELCGDPDPGAPDSSTDVESGDTDGSDDDPPDSAPPGRGGANAAALAHPELRRGRKSTPPRWLLFIPSGRIAHLSQWGFHKYDQDPFPSVPHGHGRGRRFPKLDPYLGWIHASTKRKSSRLSKKDTRALWNDEKFRDLASAALVHFIQEHPTWNWRVDNPRRLPRRR